MKVDLVPISLGSRASRARYPVSTVRFFIAPFWPGSIEIKHKNIQSDNIDNARLTRSLSCSAVTKRTEFIRCNNNKKK